MGTARDQAYAIAVAVQAEAVAVVFDLMKPVGAGGDGGGLGGEAEINTLEHAAKIGRAGRLRTGTGKPDRQLWTARLL